MSMRNSTVEIKDGKVVFSQEVLKYFESLRNEENSEWIDKYFKVLNDEENLTAEKYNSHHIRPCFSFKDNEHRKRRETKPLGDKFNGNLIKLSIYNHLFAHYYLWKIFNNEDSKTAFQRMCGQGKYIDNLTENELKEIARLKEDCAKKNIGKTASNKKYLNSNLTKRKKYLENYFKIRYLDPISNDYYSRAGILKKMKKNPNLYENLNIDDFYKTTTNSDEYRIWKNNKEKEHKENKINYIKNYKKNYKNRKNELGLRLCLDPIQKNICTYNTLFHRKYKNIKEYNNVIMKDCLI